MKFSSRSWIFVISGALLLALTQFQNCGQVQFEQAQTDQSSTLGTDDPDSGLGLPPIEEDQNPTTPDDQSNTTPPDDGSLPPVVVIPPVVTPPPVVEPLPPVCPAGTSYNGVVCVPFAAVCNQYIELSGDDIVVPPRSAGGLCYYIKMVNARPTVSSTNYPEMRTDITARSHDNGVTPYPRILGARLLEGMMVLGEREIILSGSSSGQAQIQVDNFFLLESIYETADGLTRRELFGQGTADAPLSGVGLMVDSQRVNYIPGVAGGTAIINPVDLKPFIPLNRLVDLQISALDCGGVGGTTDIYILFR